MRGSRGMSPGSSSKGRHDAGASTAVVPHGQAEIEQLESVQAALQNELQEHETNAARVREDLDYVTWRLKRARKRAMDPAAPQDSGSDDASAERRNRHKKRSGQLVAGLRKCKNCSYYECNPELPGALLLPKASRVEEPWLHANTIVRCESGDKEKPHGKLCQHVLFQLPPKRPVKKR